MIKKMKEIRGRSAVETIMNLIATPQGSRVMMGIVKAKENADKRLRGLWDFLGFPSFSDHDKVERAIGRVGGRLRDIENNLEELDSGITQLEERLHGKKLRDEKTPLSKIKAPAKPQKSKPARKAKSKSGPAARKLQPRKAKPFATRPTQTPNVPRSPLLDIKLKK